MKGFNKVKLIQLIRSKCTTNLCYKGLGVYELDVDTAGSSKKEGKIKVFTSISF
jgi:hypothetical protein